MHAQRLKTGFERRREQVMRGTRVVASCAPPSQLPPTSTMLARRLFRARPLARTAACTFRSTPARHYSTDPAASPPPTVQELLAHYSQVTTRPVTLDQLTKYGTPPLAEKELLESAENTRKELLGGLARRVSPLVPLVCGVRWDQCENGGGAEAENGGRGDCVPCPSSSSALQHGLGRKLCKAGKL